MIPALIGSSISVQPPRLPVVQPKAQMVELLQPAQKFDVLFPNFYSLPKDIESLQASQVLQ